MSTPRPVDTARLALGLGALTCPGLLLRLGEADDDARVRRVVRVLGARYVVQSAAGLALDRPWLARTDAGVDLVHALSMLGLAALVPTHRRLALLSAVAATGFAVADLRKEAR